MPSPLTSFLFLLAFASLLHAQPTLDHASPTAISPTGGQITLHGTGLKEPLSLWSIPKAKAIFSATSPTSVTCQIKLDTSGEFLGLRVATSSGISNPILIAIDDLPTLAGNGKNKSAKDAQVIELPAAVEGSVEELTSHFYKFSAHKGRKLMVDVVANRIGSRLDPLVRLLDSSGKELLFCDDDPATAPDPRFFHPIPADGQYILEIRDAAYEGSNQHRYRMRVSETDTDRFVPPPRRHYATTLPTTTEHEPNDSPSDATSFQIPAQLHGTFSKPHDRDIYQFTAKPGDHLLVRSKTRSIGSPCDLFVRIAKQTGGKIADSKTDADEASIETTLKQDGTYLLIVEELTGQSGSGMFYQLDVEPYAGFSLAADIDKIDIPAGGEAEIKISATRREYKGPIAFTLEGVPPGLQLISDTMKEDKNEAQLKIKVPTTVQAGQPFSFRLIGHANINGREYSYPLSTYPALKKHFPMMRYPPPQLDGEIGLGIKPPVPTTSPATKPTSSQTPAQQ
jgi:hypothetical protein